MKTQPIVAIIADLKDFKPYKWHAVPEPYIQAASEVANVMPLIVPAIGNNNIEGLLARVDGILLSGAPSNVHPSLYGEAESKDHEPYDKARDATSLPLIRAAIKMGMPLLAICRGMQELNVAMGGTLTAAFQKARNLDHPVDSDDDPLDKRFELAHDVKINEGCSLEKILQGEISNEKTVKVNSLHEQAVDSLGERLQVMATANDGTIEAIGIDDEKQFVVGVQWHPEYWAKTDSPSHAILSAFGKAVHNYATIKAKEKK